MGSAAARQRTQNVTLDLVDRVETILQRAQSPLSRNEILRRLARQGHATKRDRLNAALVHLSSHLVVHDAGRDGVVWLGRPSLRALERLARARVVG